MDLPRDLIDLLVAFARAKVEVVLVGGHAVSFHATPRATKDFDLLLASTDGKVVDATRSMKDDEIVYLGQPPQRIDLLRRIDGVATADVFAHAVQTTFGGVDVKVISVADLITNKKASGRPQDLLDGA